MMHDDHPYLQEALRFSQDNKSNDTTDKQIIHKEALNSEDIDRETQKSISYKKNFGFLGRFRT